MSVHESSSTPRTSTNAAESNDQPIKLIDTTKSAEPSDSENENARLSTDSGWKRLAKKPTNFSVREELARRKYAKWQPDKRSEIGGNSELQEPPPNAQTASSSQNDPEPITPAESQVQEADFGRDSTNLPERGRSPARRAETRRAKARKHHHEQAYEIDILYENQRGVFFFGVPLYSHSSLLNFDPAPWVTSNFKDSPVNITNAQVPDPSWEWVWKSWYVDMSYDVDEEGWQYSFSFARKFSWHGTHPSFHSFVRRRRWLRKRIKKHEKKADGAMSAAHMLTSDYFTIHPKRARSVSTGRDGGADASARYSFISQGTGQENIVPDEITDVASLLKSLRLSTIDREKLDAVKKFVSTAGEELALLPEHIPTIMSFFVFQASGRQLVAFLRQSIDEAGQREAKDEKAKADDVKLRTDNLRKALDATGKHIGGLEYWSEKTRSNSLLRTTDEVDLGGKTKENKPPESDPVGKIYGIPEKADVGVDFTRGAAGTGTPTSPSYDQGQEQSDGADKENEKKKGDSEPDEKGEGKSSVSKDIGEQGEQARKETLVVPD